MDLPREDRRPIGVELKTVEFGWPLGMPLVRKMDSGLWEVRVRLDRRIARILFTLFHSDDGGETRMVLLHGFIKKSQKTPADDLFTARKRLRLFHDSHV